MSETLDHLLAEETRLRLRRTRTTARLRAFPDLIAHVMGQIIPTGAAGGEKVSGSKEQKLPANFRPREDVDSLYSQLGDWATSAARTIRVAPPAHLLWFAVNDEPVRDLPIWADGWRASILTGDITTWLIRHLDRIDRLPFANDFHRDVHHWGKLFATYGFEERTLQGDCPTCNRHRLELTTVTVTKATRLRCTYCGAEPPLEQYEPVLRQILADTLPPVERRW